MPEAIEETLLEVCFGELFLLPDAATLLFDPLVLALALLAVEGFAAPLLEAVERAPLLFAAAGFALLFGAAVRAPALLLLVDSVLVLPPFPPREPATPLRVLPAIFSSPALQACHVLARQSCCDGGLWQAARTIASCATQSAIKRIFG